VDYFLVLAGLVGLFFGGDWLVKGAVGLAARLGLSAFLISLTIVGFGTSLPELLVSVRAALDGAPGLALGNVVGPNIFNILGILGITALVAPVPVAARFLSVDLWVLLAASTALTALLLLRGGFGG